MDTRGRRGVEARLRRTEQLASSFGVARGITSLYGLPSGNGDEHSTHNHATSQSVMQQLLLQGHVETVGLASATDERDDVAPAVAAAALLRHEGARSCEPYLAELVLGLPDRDLAGNQLQIAR